MSTVALPRAERGCGQGQTHSSWEHSVHRLQTGVLPALVLRHARRTHLLPALIPRHARIRHLSQGCCSGCTGEVWGQRVAQPRPHEQYRDGRASTRERARQGDAESLLGSFEGC